MWYEIFKFELAYRAKRADTYLYFVLLFLFSLIAIDFLFQDSLSPVKENAPYVIAYTMTIVSAIFMMISSMIMGLAILRDFDHNMAPLLFASPIKKRDYLLGRFLGSFVVLVSIFSALLWGMMLSELLPWRAPEDLLPFNFWHYLHPFLYLVLPTLFLGGAIFFVSGALSRKLIVVYTQGVFFFMVYLFAMVWAQNYEESVLPSLLDPFSFQTVNYEIQFWTVAERNSHMLPVAGILLYNRLLWMLFGAVVLAIGYYSFRLDGLGKKKAKVQQKPHELANKVNQYELKIPRFTPVWDIRLKCLQLIHNSLFYFKSILNEASFWAIVICGMLIIFINSISLGISYGVNSYPTTYLIVEELQEMSIYFFLIILVFYSGELVWKERDAKMDLIYDALPHADFISLAGKFLGLLLTYLILIIALIFSGILFQTLKGYYQYELDVYFMGFFVEIFFFLVLFTIISFFFQVLANHKFMGHLLVVIFFVVIQMLEPLGYGHDLYRFGGGDLGTYSDMNGYGHFLAPYLWVKVYWFSFGIILFILATIFSIRGQDTRLKVRWRLGKQRISKSLIKLGKAAILILILSGAYIFYNTNVLNTHWSGARQEAFRADYEKTLKQYEYFPQPKIVSVSIQLDLFPSDRQYLAEGRFILKNTHREAITQIHIQKLLQDAVDIRCISFERGAILKETYLRFSYYIYELRHPLLPGDSLEMAFTQTYTPQGFELGTPATRIVHNGSFFSSDEFPGFGYNSSFELKSKNDREKYGLAPRPGKARRDDPRELVLARSGGDGYKINFDMLIATDSSQIAIAPGNLEKEWREGNRRFFHYKMDKPMVNFYSVVSARYEVMQDSWLAVDDGLSNPVSLEIYYHKGHTYNLERMMKSMKASLDYFSEAFGPYPYRQMRIMEFPRYASFAQSFPNTVPYSEALGFVMDIDEEEDVDMAFYITAHELAHQWWGLQVVAANVQGKSMILESLAQYSALMVMKQVFSEEKVQQFIKSELNRYLSGRANEKYQEKPLALVESQAYIHYGKGAVNLYALQNYISEEAVNLALKRFIRDWNSIEGQIQQDRYATTEDLLGYFEAVTPDSMQYMIGDLFEKIIVYENKIIGATSSQQETGSYTVQIQIEAQKYQLDSLGHQSSIEMREYMDLAIYGINEIGEEKMIYIEKHRIEKGRSNFEIVVNEKPLKVVIDPKLKFIDRNLKDNVRVLEGQE